VIHLTDITKQHGNRILYKNGNLQISPGDKIGLVGPNGAGKTTIFRIITGEEGIDSGTISLSDKTVIGYFSQDVGEMAGRSALEEVMTGAGKVSTLAKRLKELEKALEDAAIEPPSDDAFQKLIEDYGDVQMEFESRGGYDLENRSKEILTGLGIGPTDYDRPVETFSGGWKMRIELAKILILNPDVLLMDEPTNHLDLETIIWLEGWLAAYKGALMMTSHDREFMNRLVSRIVEIANQNITSYTGNYDYYEREREIRKEQLIAASKKQQDMLAKEEEFIARFAARASHAAQVQSRVKKLEKIDRIEIPPEERTARFDFPTAPRSGNDVVKLDQVAKTWRTDDGKEKLVFQGVHATVKRLEKIAVVGVNGAGKSTLLKCIAGEAHETSGVITIGANVKIGYFSQHSLDVLNPNKTLEQEIHDRIPQSTIGYVRNLLGAFLFSGDDVEKKISVLSGGEKSRLVLATILASPVNLLILDEPTNHLDIRTREVLMKAIQDFDGTVLIVSHDRHFLRSVSNKVYEVGHGEVRMYPGGYQSYLEQKKA
jgi:ATP-binding cassette, subfamily F, member 3